MPLPLLRVQYYRDDSESGRDLARTAVAPLRVGPAALVLPPRPVPARPPTPRVLATQREEGGTSLGMKAKTFLLVFVTQQQEGLEWAPGQHGARWQGALSRQRSHLRGEV